MLIWKSIPVIGEKMKYIVSGGAAEKFYFFQYLSIMQVKMNFWGSSFRTCECYM